MYKEVNNVVPKDHYVQIYMICLNHLLGLINHLYELP